MVEDIPPQVNLSAGASVAVQQPHLQDACPSLPNIPDAAVCAPGDDGLSLFRLEVQRPDVSGSPGSLFLTNEAGNTTEIPCRSEAAHSTQIHVCAEYSLDFRCAFIICRPFCDFIAGRLTCKTNGSAGYSWEHVYCYGLQHSFYP